jgi:hypothetical protein
MRVVMAVFDPYASQAILIEPPDADAAWDIPVSTPDVVATIARPDMTILRCIAILLLGSAIPWARALSLSRGDTKSS